MGDGRQSTTSSSARCSSEDVGPRLLPPNASAAVFLKSVSGLACRSPITRERNRIVGIDISQPMLEKARKRVETLGLGHVETLSVMDAEQLTFPDAAFDVVVAQYVVTAIPNPEKALDEFVRVVRPGGEIVLTSRIGAETGLRGTLEKWLMPVTSRLGWRTEFPWTRYEQWAKGSGAVRLLERRALPPMGHFWLIRFVRVDDATGSGSGSETARKFPVAVRRQHWLSKHIPNAELFARLRRRKRCVCPAMASKHAKCGLI